MLKGVKKGIKKKIKGKKDKKEDDLFDPEQLEKYKRELEEAKKAKQQQDEESGYAGAAGASSSAGHEDDEEWQRFKMLTSGVDVLVNKVSEDLDRIKESSFFQRNKPSEQNRKFASERPPGAIIPTPEKETIDPTDLHNAEEDGHEGENDDQTVPEGAEGFEGEDTTDTINKVPDSPEPVELDDSLFDTTFLDAIAAGEIKLAYIPDSPTHEDGDDPFDTSAVADVVKRIEEEEKKAKKQVNLGNAVDFLTGKVDKTGIERPRARPGEMKAKARPRPQAINLLGDFDDGSAPTAPPPDTSKKGNEKVEKPTDLFDKILDAPMKDTASPLLEKVDLLPAKAVETDKEGASKSGESPKDKGIKDVISEFDIISQLDPISGSAEPEPLTSSVPSSIPSSIAALLAPAAPEEDELDDEFAALAAESIHKKPPPGEDEPEEEEEDPFDTSYVDTSAAHGKCELKIIENEILGDVKTSEAEGKPALEEEDDFDFDPRAGESPPKSLEIQNAPKLNPLEDLSPHTVKAPTMQPHVKGGGPTSVDADGTQGEDKSAPEEDIDPFDTSKLETVLPGKAELKLLEAELLSSVEQATLEQPKLPEKIVSAIIKSQQTVDDDFDFNPRQDEVKQHMLDLHDVSHHAFDTVSKVLTPQLEQDIEIDPFDTSAVAASGLIPGPLELKLLEDELVSPTVEAPPTSTSTVQPKLTRTASDDDFDFDPREGQPAPVPKPLPTTEDIFDSTMDFAVDKPLSPQLEMPSNAVPEPKLCPTNVEDPFDTSGIQIENYLAKSELRQVEEELLNTPPQPMPARALPVVVAVEYKRPPPQQVIPQPQPPPPPAVPHILEAMTPTDDSIKPLTPLEAPTGVISVFNPSPAPYIDPFDTSIAEAVIPGKTEIKLLEEELGVGGGRRLSDPDFDPREPSHPSNQMISQPLTPMPMQPVMKPVSKNNASSTQKPAEVDPFDTSAAETVMPGKAELKALENELL